MLMLSHLEVKRNYADRCKLIENRNAINSEIRTQYCKASIEGVWTSNGGLCLLYYWFIYFSRTVKRGPRS